jgi:hypothetical protein
VCSRIRIISVIRHIPLVGRNYNIHLMKSKSCPLSSEVLRVAAMKNIAFCDMTSRTMVGFHRRFGRIYCFHLQCQRVRRVLFASSYMLYRFSLKIEAESFSKTSINSHLTTRRRTPQDSFCPTFLILKNKRSFMR